MFWLNDKFEIWYMGTRKQIPKEEVEKILLKRVAKNTSKVTYVNQSDKAVYSDVLHFMLVNLKDAVRIQIYNDGAVRIYLHDIFMKYTVNWDTVGVYDDLYNMFELSMFLIDVENYK